MAIRDRFRRALHKSTSDSNMSQVDSHTTTRTTGTTSPSATSSHPSSLHTQHGNKFGFPWGRSDKDKEHRKEDKEKKKYDRKKAAGKPVHPRDKPLTATNLRHQEVLGGFDFSFGSSPSRLSQIVPAGPWEWDYVGVSPCCTRPGSINGDSFAPLEEDSDRRPSTAEAPKVAVPVSVPA
ncbi:hypothetical protein ACO1O0_000879 [Amphichorda felina]